MNSAILNQFFKGNTGDLAPHRVKPGQYDRLRSIVNDKIGPCQGFKCPNIPSLTTYYASLHLVVGKSDYGHGAFCNLIRRAPLYRLCKDVYKRQEKELALKTQYLLDLSLIHI